MRIKTDPIHQQRLYQNKPGVHPKWRYWLLALLIGFVACSIGGWLLTLLFKAIGGG